MSPGSIDAGFIPLLPFAIGGAAWMLADWWEARQFDAEYEALWERLKEVRGG